MMNNYNLYAFFLLCLGICTSLVFGAEKNCNKLDFDKHSANVWGQFGLPELSFPENSAALVKYCKTARTSIDFAKQYGKNCLKSTSQTLMALATYNFDQVNKPYCAKSGKQKDDFMKWAKCGNPAKKQGTTQCWDKMILTMANAGKMENSKDKLPAVCCTFYRWMDCTRKAIENTKNAPCSKDVVDGYIGYIDRASVESLNLVCSRYEADARDASKCKSLFDKVPNNKPKRLDKMPLLYVFDIFDKL